MADLATAFNDTADCTRYTVLADRVRERFQQVFWNDATGCLYDVIADDGKSRRLHPAQPGFRGQPALSIAFAASKPCA